MCRVSHLKKFVYDKFEIDAQRFSIDIMYKVKTIVLLDYYTLMDIAYIYTWKRDAPMRFYYRVYESPQPLVKPAPRRVLPLKLEKHEKENQEQQLAVEASPPKAEPAPLPEVQASIKVEQQEAIKEVVKEVVKEATAPPPTTEPLKLVINRTMLEKREKSHSPQTSSKSSSKNSPSTPVSSPSEPNIKLKIDLSKQNSVTIINMSDPERREIVKPLKPEKESRSKKKDKDGSPKSSSSSSSNSSGERKRKSPSPLTVPPLTIRTERIMSPSGVSTLSPRVTSGAFLEDPKSEFLKSFALKPIKVKVEPPERMTNSRAITPPSGASQKLPSPKSKGNLDDSVLMKPPSCMPPKSIASSKRKSKDPVKAVSKKPKLSPPLPTVDFKIRLPATNGNPPASATPKIEKPLMPPPSKPPMLVPRKLQPSSQFATPPSPMHQHAGVQMSAPGNRTPIAKRYQPILPKASRPNPFANIPNDVNRLLKDAGTEIKSIGSGSGENTSNSTQKSHVYGPKGETKMGPPPSPAISANGTAAPQGNRSLGKQGSNSQMSAPNKSNSANNYLNLALFNSSKSKGKEAPPGCRTPMYTPNSPIYSPSSPQYVPSYNIPTMPTYKYTPKPTGSAGTGSGGAGSYLQNMLGGSSGGSLGGLFPSPPTKSDQNTNPAQGGSSSGSQTGGHGNANGNLYLPNEDAPEKQQVKVKSLLNSCNINIPSSLSITISRDNGDPSSPSNGQHPKHKSPVNNYIEIVKLPDQPQDQGQAAKEAQKRQSPPAAGQGPQPAKLPPPPPSKAIPSPQHLMSRMTPPQLPQVATPPPPSAPRVITPPKSSPPANAAKGTPLKPVLTPTQGDKKTPSPEKRNAAQMGSHSPTASENKSPKGGANAGTATQNGDPAAKKFRPILPRQNAMPELAPKLPTLAPPFGFNPPQNPATGKKVPPSKKSPNAGATGHQPGQQKLANGGSQAPQKPSPPQKNQQQSKKVSKNPTPPPPSLPGMGKMLPHPVMHSQNAPLSIASSASAAAVASGQLDLTNFIKENLMRVQAAQAAQAAAAANQSNMMYNFAQMGHMSPAMYGYQQAYLMEQLSRMQRAGNEVFNDYLQKLKSAAVAGGAGGGGPAEGELKPMLPTVTLPSPGATPPAASPKTSPLPVGKLAAAATAPQTKGNGSSGASARQQTAATGNNGATASAASLPPATKSK